MLGDDIVIGDIKVGAHYLTIMRDILGVDINLSKSLESTNGVCEFAKRLISPSENVTPIGTKVTLQAIRSIYFFPSLVRNMLDVGITIDVNALLTLSWDPTLPLRGGIGRTWYKVV